MIDPALVGVNMKKEGEKQCRDVQFYDCKPKFHMTYGKAITCFTSDVEGDNVL